MDMDAYAVTDHPGVSVVALDRIEKADDQLLGGTGAQLAELASAGFPVPPGFCVTTDHFRAFFRRTAVPHQVRAAAADPAAIRRGVLERELPAEIAEPVLAAYRALGSPRVAVRSSAVGDDGAAQPAGGRLATVLDVEGEQALLAAIKECWASFWANRAAAGRPDPIAAGEIAVVVQQMVAADAGGVVLTADPGRQPHRMVVEGGWGLGDGLMLSGTASDYFVVDERTGQPVEERIGYKTTRRAVLRPGVVGSTPVDAADRSTPCLTHEQLADLVRLAAAVRSHFSGDQEIAWSLRDGAFHILQSRPVTPRPHRSEGASLYVTPQPPAITRGTLWSRMDIGEIYAGIMTPLGRTFTRHYQMTVHSECFRAAGARDVGDAALHMGYLDGHVYLNISSTAYVLSQCLPMRDQMHFTSRFASEDTDLDTYRNPFGRFPGGVGDLRSLAFWAKSTLTEMVKIKERAAAMDRRREREFDRARTIDLTGLSRSELDTELARCLRYVHDANVGYLPYYLLAFGLYGLLTEMCSRWLGADGDAFRSRLKSDMSRLRTGALTRDIRVLAEDAQNRPQVLRIIQRTPTPDIRAALLADRDGRQFWDTAMQEFLRAHGARGRQEMELTHPRWIDDPSYVFQMIRRYVQDGGSAEEVLTRGRDRDAAAVLGRLPAVKRAVLEKVISLYVMCSEVRESTRTSMVTSVWLVRRVVYEVGRRLVEAGVLRTLDEVAYLDFADILRYLGGTADARRIFPAAAIDEARREFHYQRRLPEPPLNVIGRYEGRQQPGASQAAAPAGAGALKGGVLQGVGASPGTVTGRARVIEDLAWQAGELRPGEIMVARFADISWTPMIAAAAGVVTDLGSRLSHSSTVAREFHVPSVVGTKHATQRIRTGDLIAVDGVAGTVTVLSPAVPS